MRILVTGSAGHIGKYQVKLLREAGYEVRTFDRVAAKRDEDWEHIPGDLRDLDTVRQVVRGIDAVAHLGAISSDWGRNAEEVFTVNVQGTLNLLLACAEADIGRMVFFSSVNALGNFGGHKSSAYLPIDDSYFPHHPMTPYQLSKHLGEEACRSFTDRYGMVTVCLRPVYVTAERSRRRRPEQGMEQRIAWSKDDYWAYVDVHDVCEAALLGLRAENVTHDAFLLTADDTFVDKPTAELVDTYYPDTPWPRQDRAAYLADNPYRSLVDCSHAKEVLGWQPKHSWRDAAPTP